MATPNTIVLKGDPIYKEELASEAITPGMLLEWVPSGANAGKVRKHATAGGVAESAFAIEQSLVGDEIGTAYASGDTVRYVIARKGDEIYAFLGPSESVDAGQGLDSKGDGSLKKRTTGNFPVAVAAESVNNIGGTTNKRIRISVI